jgi:hypothetical protein
MNHTASQRERFSFGFAVFRLWSLIASPRLNPWKLWLSARSPHDKVCRISGGPQVRYDACLRGLNDRCPGREPRHWSSHTMAKAKPLRKRATDRTQDFLSSARMARPLRSRRFTRMAVTGRSSAAVLEFRRPRPSRWHLAFACVLKSSKNRPRFRPNLFHQTMEQVLISLPAGGPQASPHRSFSRSQERIMGALSGADGRWPIYDALQGLSAFSTTTLARARY